MSFANLGVIPFLLGLAAIAGLLFLLQRLRVRFREEEVVTTLFWKQAVEETRARMLTKRFRHPLSYLLALAIAGLVWLALAKPDWNRKDKTDYIFLLDGSAGMDWGNQWEEAKRLLREEVDRIPAERRRVYFCGADARLILDRGDEASLLLPRLEPLSPEACPGSIERISLALASDETSTREIRILVVGDASVSKTALAMLPDKVIIERLRSDNTPRLENNIGLSAIGVAESVSGSFGRVDVLIETRGTAEGGFAVSLDGEVLDRPLTREGDTYFLRDVPARGEVLEIALAGDEPLMIDNSARIRLPSRRTVAVTVDENLDERFHALVEADPALARVSGNSTGSEAPQVAIGGLSDGSLPAIELVTGNGITVIYEEDISSIELEELQARFSGTGLDRVGWKLGPDTDVTGELSLTPRFVPGEKRKVQIGVELIGSSYDFIQTSAFPLFVSTAIRWLAQVDRVEPFAVAGERLAHSGHLTIAGSDYAPPRAGKYAGPGGKELEVSLAAVSPPGLDALEQVARSTDAGRWPGIFTWCILLALVLAVGEWWLFQKSRIP